ncbi:hypothetical protein [Streptomyces sp. KL2]|uniref:hypothetical protein n=1 Tax=Streptomyces sp. KL2 TaxID=3050126 RepID=UPI00397E0A1A
MASVVEEGEPSRGPVLSFLAGREVTGSVYASYGTGSRTPISCRSNRRRAPARSTVSSRRATAVRIRSSTTELTGGSPKSSTESAMAAIRR